MHVGSPGRRSCRDGDGRAGGFQRQHVTWDEALAMEGGPSRARQWLMKCLGLLFWAPPIRDPTILGSISGSKEIGSSQAGAFCHMRI